MKRLCASLYALVLLSVLSSLPPTQAQSSPAETRAIETRTMEPYYDIARRSLSPAQFRPCSPDPPPE